MHRDRRGSIMIEFVAACLVLVAIFTGITETALLIKDRIYLQRVVRDGAREAAITGNIEAGRYKAQDRALQYFGNNKAYIDIDTEQYGNVEYITCSATYPHSLATGLGRMLTDKEVMLNAKAVYGWYDKSTTYR